MMRPVLNPSPELRGTAADQFVFVCRCDADAPWGLIVFIKTSHLMHSVLVPVLESEAAAARFVAFLKGEGCRYGPTDAGLMDRIGMEQRTTNS